MRSLTSCRSATSSTGVVIENEGTMICTTGDLWFKHWFDSQSKTEPLVKKCTPRVTRSPNGNHLVHRLYGIPGKGFGTRILFRTQRRVKSANGKHHRMEMEPNIFAV